MDAEILKRAEQRLKGYLSDDRPPEECWIPRVAATTLILMIGGVKDTLARWAWIVWRGDIPAKRSVMRTCVGYNCINPSHLRLSTDPNAPRPSAEEILRRQAERIRERNGNFVWADIDEIRASDKPGVILAKRYNVSTSTISSIRMGRSWVRRYGER